MHTTLYTQYWRGFHHLKQQCSHIPNWRSCSWAVKNIRKCGWTMKPMMNCQSSSKFPPGFPWISKQIGIDWVFSMAHLDHLSSSQHSLATMALFSVQPPFSMSVSRPVAPVLPEFNIQWGRYSVIRGFIMTVVQKVWTILNSPAKL